MCGPQKSGLGSGVCLVDVGEPPTRRHTYLPREVLDILVGYIEDTAQVFLSST